MVPHKLILAHRPSRAYMELERLVRAGASPTWSEPEGSSHNESRLGRYQSLTQAFLHSRKAQMRQSFLENDENIQNFRVAFMIKLTGTTDPKR